MYGNYKTCYFIAQPSNLHIVLGKCGFTVVNVGCRSSPGTVNITTSEKFCRLKFLSTSLLAIWSLSQRKSF